MSHGIEIDLTDALRKAIPHKSDVDLKEALTKAIKGSALIGKMQIRQNWIYTPIQRGTSETVILNGIPTKMTISKIKNYRSIEEPFESSRIE